MRPGKTTCATLFGLLVAGSTAASCGLQQQAANDGTEPNTGGAGAAGAGASYTAPPGPGDYSEGGGGDYSAPTLVDFPECEGVPLSRTVTITPDDARATGSATYAHAALSALEVGDDFGLPPAPSSMHPHQMVSYYGLGDAPGEQGVLEAAPFIDESGVTSTTDIMIQVAVSAPPGIARRGVHVAFVVDTSGSMTGAAMAHQKALLTQAATRLGQGDGADVVSVVSWAGDAETLLSAQEVTPNDPALLEVIDGLESKGGSRLASGLSTALELVTSTGHSLERIVFITDGAASLDSAGEVLTQIRARTEASGLGFIGVGVGPAESYHATLLKEMMLQTDGTFLYVGSEADAAEVFGTRFDGLMDSVGTDVRLTLTLPGYLDPGVPLKEELSEEFQNLISRDFPIGGTLVIRRRLVACDAGVFSSNFTAVDEVRAVVEYIDRGGETVTLQPTPLLVHSLVQAEPVRMQRARVLIDYGLALRVPTAASVTHAQTQLFEANLTELRDLLGRHPVLSN